ncbi:hypothetical protein MMC11_003998 [Xylographa trunciseda]|nr:hypothetical protein [Xylographa trunciseda]
MDIDRCDQIANSTPRHGQLPSQESLKHRTRVEDRIDAYSSNNAWPYSTRQRPSSSSSLGRSTPGNGPGKSSFRPPSFTSLGSSIGTPSPPFWEPRDPADKPTKNDGDRKEESKKAHKESERDRRNIENACIQQLKRLTHSECYMNVKSKYRDEPAKNEILARANAFIMALVLRLNAELAQTVALEQDLVDLRHELTALPRRPEPHPAHPPDGQLDHQPPPSSTLRPPVPSPRAVHARPAHCAAPACRSSAAHYEAWYDSPLCRRWLDGPDGVLAHTLETVGAWHAGIATIVRAFERFQAAHPTVVPWNASALVAAFASMQAGNAVVAEWDTEALVRVLERTAAARFAIEPASVEALVGAMARGER